ncbi:MAG: beta-propeller fold lactonase family protein, partial [Planctomycetota bacterium]
IYHARLDLATGEIEGVELAGEVVNPSFLAVHPSRGFLYAVGEIANFEGKRAGAVSAFSIDPGTGKLTLLNQRPSEGTGPCHLVVDQTGKNVLVANYGSGSVASLPIGEDGRLGEATSAIQHEGSSVNPQRQQGPHAHSINLDAANRFAFAADLGLDKIFIYRFDHAGTLEAADPPWAKVAPGAGPRHFAFHPGGRLAYVINELDSTVTAFEYDARRGVLTSLETVSTLPPGFEGESNTAEVQVHPSGKFLYGSNRGHDSIAAFAIDPQTGRLRFVAHESTQGKTPRNFGIDPTGAYLLAANQATDNVVVFRIDPETGALGATGHSASVPSPVCVKMLTPSPTAPVAAEPDGWRDLLARGLVAWHNGAGGRPSLGWAIEEGVLVRKDRAGYIWTKERWSDFVLDLEFKTEGNSGIFIRTDDPQDCVQTGIEIQVYTPVEIPGKGSCGAVYDCLAPTKETCRAGEWNHVTITAADNKLAVEMNGQQIIDMDLNQWTEPGKNPDGTKNKFRAALKDFKREGHVGFQDHGAPVAYRNIRIKPLGAGG